LDYLEKCGFKVSPERSVYKNISDVKAKIEQLGQNRKSFVSDIDGAVVKVNDFNMRNALGSTSSAPRWAVAYKYPPETAETILESISIKVGRTGVLTPNAEFRTVQLAGTKVSRATLHNIDYITQKDIRIGDTIIVRKAGDIIPEVVGVNKEKRPDNSVPYEFPEVCPTCKGKLFREAGEAAIRCVNIGCPAQLHRNICHFASRDAMNIETLGENIIKDLLDNNIIKNVSDLYELKVEDLVPLERMGEKRASNIVSAIEHSKEAGLGKLLFALGIRHIGEKAAASLASFFGSIERIINATVEEISSIDDFGMVSAERVYRFFKNEDNLALVEKLKSVGVVMENRIEISSDLLTGLTVVITGTLPTLKRSEAEELVVKNGGKCSSSVSKKTSFVLCGDAPGSKLTKAEALGVPVLNEDEFLERIGLK
jgi:DNA ligase (NAD+)